MNAKKGVANEEEVVPVAVGVVLAAKLGWCNKPAAAEEELSPVT